MRLTNASGASSAAHADAKPSEMASAKKSWMGQVNKFRFIGQHHKESHAL
jgi:hypothetical protein